MKVYVFTRIPPRRGLLGPIPESWSCDTIEDDAIATIVDRLHVPIGGEAIVVTADDATVVRSRVVNEVAS